MGKKSKKGGGADAPADGKPRCCSCKLFLKQKKNGEVCPGCDKLYCDLCASFGSRKKVGFVACQGEGCPHPPRCTDCAFGKTIGSICDENKARKERGEPAIAEKENKCEYPLSMCDNCNEILCFECHAWNTNGVMGHYYCVPCGKTRCHACCIEKNGPEHFIMHCSGCNTPKCSECDPKKAQDVGGDYSYYCGDCSSDPDISEGKQLRLVFPLFLQFLAKKK